MIHPQNVSQHTNAARGRMELRRMRVALGMLPGAVQFLERLTENTGKHRVRRAENNSFPPARAPFSEKSL